MIRRVLALPLLVLLCAWSCHEARRGEAPTTAREASATARIETPPVSGAEQRDAATSEANEHVESARILSLPIDPLPAGVIRGMALPTYTELPDLSYDQMLARVKDAGATHVSIVVSWNQQTIHHNRLK